MNRERVPRQSEQAPQWLGIVLAAAICLPFWAAFAWLVSGLI